MFVCLCVADLSQCDNLHLWKLGWGISQASDGPGTQTDLSGHLQLHQVSHQAGVWKAPTGTHFESHTLVLEVTSWLLSCYPIILLLLLSTSLTVCISNSHAHSTLGLKLCTGGWLMFVSFSFVANSDNSLATQNSSYGANLLTSLIPSQRSSHFPSFCSIANKILSETTTAFGSQADFVLKLCVWQASCPMYFCQESIIHGSLRNYSTSC